MNNKKKIILTSTGLFLLVVIAVTGTYAWFKWRTTLEQTVNVNLTATSVITFIGGPDVNGIIDPAYTYSGGLSKNIRITSELPGSTFNLYFKINSIASELTTNAYVLWAIYNGNTLINSGNFNNATEGDNIVLFTDRNIPSDSYDTYTFYLWLDAMKDLDSTITNKSLSLSLYATGESGTVNEIDS